MEDFWLSYRALALIIFGGVIIGIPVSLWVEKRRHAKLERKKRRERTTR